MKQHLTITLSLFLLINILPVYAKKKIPSERVLQTTQLYNYLQDDVKNKLGAKKNVSEATLAKYFREKFSERFFYDWQTFSERFKEYNDLYSKQSSHKSRAEDHLSKFDASTQWLLPFNYLNGKPVNAYALRHLARQHKMVDIAFQYFYDNKDPKYIQYFTGQMQSLNTALQHKKYETIEDGNGVYEAFRGGYRVLNWLSIHNMFLGEETYTDKDQLRTIATLLQHGQHLYEHNVNFKAGNHQTRGVSALAMLAILLRDFKGTELWYDRAMERLEEHLSKEINNDGFQFERSVHYHISDISNYFYVYQLAQISQVPIDKVWKDKLYSLFTTLVKVAYPDKSAPVLQDDTIIPWADKNDISGVMTLGYMLFREPVMGYFAQDTVHDKFYWFLKKEQLASLQSIEKEKPKYGSFVFPNTHYYIMREGWNKDDKMMVISAGVDKDKPDHQHGDILGVQAIANGKAILPNYQVRYSLTDYDVFKNSMVKNVALVDNELQGKQWRSNKGGSGFGKFGKLPSPKVIAWESNNDFDFFAGSHNGFEDIGVKYSRQVIYIKDDFWIVKDNFHSDSVHTYKQVWQGHYTQESNPNIIRSVFSDASGCDILQLHSIDSTYSSGTRGKQWNVVSKNGEKDFSFISVIYPYKGYSNRLDENTSLVQLKDWTINNSQFSTEDKTVYALSQADKSFLFGVQSYSKGNLQLTFSEETDIYVKEIKEGVIVCLLGDKAVEVNISGSHSNKVEGVQVDKHIMLKTGEFLECEF